MSVARCELESLSPYGQGRYYETPKLEGESHKDYEVRTWRDRCHVDGDGNIFIPSMAFKNGLAEAAKYMALQIPGKGKATYTKHFEAGVMVVEGLPLPIKKDDVEGLWLFVPASGKRGDSKRVSKCFPVIREWQGTVEFHVIDEVITQEVFAKTLRTFGKFIGVGFFRPRNNGYFGRFKVNGIQWTDERDDEA